MVGRARLLTVLAAAIAVIAGLSPHTAWAGGTTFGAGISANQVETDTPTPTPTETPTETPTPTLTGTAAQTESATPQLFYVIVTLQSGQEAAFKYEITAGEGAIFAELVILIVLIIFGLFLIMRNVNR
jgi:hypothetical protein